MFSQADYNANTEKYKLFQTARMSVDIPHSPLKKGDVVAIRYLDARVNAVYLGNPVMPIYEIVGLKHYVFATALSDFLL